MKPRIIFCDCDGTLIGSTLVVSDATKEAIRKWEEKGNLFSVATGRQYAGFVQALCKELHLTSPQILNAGAEIRDPLTHNVLYSVCFDDHEIQSYIQLLQHEDIPFWIEQHNSVYIFD